MSFQIDHLGTIHTDTHESFMKTDRKNPQALIIYENWSFTDWLISATLIKTGLGVNKMS